MKHYINQFILFFLVKIFNKDYRSLAYFEHSWIMVQIDFDNKKNCQNFIYFLWNLDEKKIGLKEAQDLSLAPFDRCKKLIKNKVTSEICQNTIFFINFGEVIFGFFYFLFFLILTFFLLFWQKSKKSKISSCKLLIGVPFFKNLNLFRMKKKFIFLYWIPKRRVKTYGSRLLIIIGFLG